MLNPGWRQCTLGEVVQLKRGYDLPQKLRIPGPIPIISSSGFSDTHNASKVSGPGVVTGRYGTIGSVFYVREDFWPLNTTLYVKDFFGNDPRFISYFLRTIDYHSYSDKAAVPGINRNHLHEAKVLLPSLFEQQAISSVLAVLDDKIDLNRRMNETLEAMARALFRDWFVDFGPTRAKMEGRPPYLAPEIWNLFPDRLDDEEKPEEWRYGVLGDIADAPGRVVKPTALAEDTPYIGLEHMPRRSIALTDWGGAGKVSSNKSVFKTGEFLFGKLRPYFHKVGVAPLDGICSTDIVVVVPNSREWSGYTLACLSSDEFVEYTNLISTGTKMPRTSWATMKQYKVCLPQQPVVNAFQEVLEPLLERIITNIHESRSLAQTRDLLLPKLISGEIRLVDAEKRVTRVA